MLRVGCVLAMVVVCGSACDATKVGEQCVAADLVGQCPAGSNPVLGAAASTSCGGTFEGQTIGDGMAVSGQCGANGTCEFLCQFEVPCTCGVATLTKEAIVCAECQDQSCGDGRCEGTERPGCAPGEEGCFPCAEDCGGSTCGDGDCTGDESPETCPQDCAATCVPNARSCIGTRVSVCAADGHTTAEVDCATVGQVCADGQCVAPNVCGNGLCEAGEDASCAADCARVCDPASRRCDGAVLVVCAADGESEARTDCAASGEVCSGGQCRPANVCGNGVCEAGEEACSQDCQAVCGNGRCDNNEEVSCPRDCVVCGDGTCGAGEIESCPQDCGICVPSKKECLGKILRVCNANGTAYDDVDCAGLGLSCARGDCVEPNVCGNGICDPDESEASCERDCAEVCGNGRCGGLEVFETCAIDCDPVCGDGTCEGDEDSLGCSFDCLATCGNAACDGLEDRDNCPRDCGFCGDGACQDGAESASLTPPAGQESCVVDCVITGCQRDSDCDDKVGCTANQCLNGSCIYTADDDLCVGDERCIKFHGCCPDDDGDGYADIACGGSDCDDQDGDVHPGALEPCGGGDRNCNGVHRPALAPAKKLTANASNKRFLDAESTGDAMMLVWSGKSALYEQLEMLPVSWGLIAEGAVKVVSQVRVNENMPRIHVAYHPTKNALGAMWAVAGGGISENKAGWIGLDGSVVGELTSHAAYGCVINGVTYTHVPVPYGAIVNGDGVLFSARAVYYVNESNVFSYSSGWLQLAATGNLSIAHGAPCEGVVTPTDLVRVGDLVTGLAGTGQFVPTSLVTIDTSVPGSGQTAAWLDDGHAGTCALGEDGELLATACVAAGATTVQYRRATQNGSVFYEAEVMSGAHTPIGIGRSAERPGAVTQVGVVTRDGGNNLWFFARDQAGEPVLEPAIVAGGETVGGVSVLHDGNDFVLVWLAKVQGFEQVFGQRITCE